ncbi:MAG: hypothetical protein MI757_13770 [Pirellulales bacterium]|nr:hypothetical protein [Pirellulales bacterium]
MALAQPSAARLPIDLAGAIDHPRDPRRVPVAVIGQVFQEVAIDPVDLAAAMDP